MRRPLFTLVAPVLALSVLAACSTTTLPSLPFIKASAPVAPPVVAPPVAAPAPVDAPGAPSALAAFEVGIAAIAAESGVMLEKTAEGELLLRAAGDSAVAPSSTTLTPRFAAFLKQLASRLAQQQSLNVKITGHTDATGNAQRNDKLSEGRALAAARVLTQNGVADFRVAAKGKGKHEPIADNDTATGRASNRRVDIVITEGR
jgi:outer membrane protein OmpA-like peptidoglycan-associated protein